jgi:hypothetical protein
LSWFLLKSESNNIQVGAKTTPMPTPGAWAGIAGQANVSLTLRAKILLTNRYYDCKIVLIRRQSMKNVICIILISSLFFGCSTLVKIESNVPNSSVYLDGKYIGQTPTEVKMSNRDKPQIEISKDGYSPYIGYLQNELKILPLIGGLCLFFPIFWCYGPKETQFINLKSADSSKSNTTNSLAANKKSFENDDIYAVLTISNSYFDELIVKNKTNKVILLLGEMASLSSRNINSKLIPTGTPDSEKFQIQSNTVIPPMQTVTKKYAYQNDYMIFEQLSANGTYIFGYQIDNSTKYIMFSPY